MNIKSIFLHVKLPKYRILNGSKNEKIKLQRELQFFIILLALARFLLPNIILD